MANWVLRWNFNKPAYGLGERAIVNFWIENTGDTYIYLSKLELNFDFGTYDLESIGGVVSPRENRFLGNSSLLLPMNVVGTKVFQFRYFMHEYVGDDWLGLGSYESDRQYFIGVYPTPFYRVFVSRGLSIEDRAIGDPIAEMVREWGFETATLGIEVQVSEEQVSMEARQQIRAADAMIAIATPRFMDALTGLWRTFEWYHDEVGIGFGIDRPLLILKDRRVVLGGLPSYLVSYQQALSIEFDPYNLDDTRVNISAVMPAFREWIETGRKQSFFESVSKILVGIGAIAIMSGIIGALSQSSKK